MMANNCVESVLNHIRHLASKPYGDSNDSDDALLRRYVDSTCEESFAALVRRHGSMVFAVCQSIAGHRQDAEDAFQATFLVLAEKADSIRKRHAVASWLHGVAARLAHKVRRPRPRHSLQPADELDGHAAQRLDDLTIREAQTILHEEIAQLPEKNRAPILLCHLEELTQDEAAARLGWTLGALRGRLLRGRDLLRKKLQQRGLCLSIPMFASAFVVSEGEAARFGTLWSNTIEAVLASVHGNNGVSTVAAKLANGMLSNMMKKKVLAYAGVVAAATLAFGATLWAQHAFVPDGKSSVTTKKASIAKPKMAKPISRLGSAHLRTAADAFALTPDGRTLLTLTRGHTLGYRDATTGRFRSERYLTGSLTYNCWFSSDAKLVAVPQRDRLDIWETATGKRKYSLSVHPMHAAFTPDGRYLATAQYTKDVGRIRIWNLATGKDRQIAELPSYANDLAFSQDGKRLYAAVDNHSLRCWNMASGRQLWRNDHWASHVVVSADGRVLASDTYLQSPIHLWDAATGEKIASYNPTGMKHQGTSRLLFSPNGELIAQATWSRGVFLWDIKAKKVRHHFDWAGSRLAFSPDGRSLFTLRPLLQKWDVQSGRHLYADIRSHSHVGAVTGVAFSPNGRSLASCGEDGTVRIWKVASGRHRVIHNPDPQVQTGCPGYLEFTLDGRRLLAEVAPGTLALTAISTGKKIARFELPDRKSMLTSFVATRLSRDGQKVVAVGRTYMEMRGSVEIGPNLREPLHVWDVNTGRKRLSRQVPCMWRAGGAISPNGELLVTPYTDKLHHVPTGDALALRDAPRNLGPPFAFSPDNHLLAAPEPGILNSPTKAIRIYETLTGQQLIRIKAEVGNCRALVFSPDSRVVFAVGTDAVHAWQCSNGKRVWHLPANGNLTGWTPSSFARCAAVAPDGRSIATGHLDGSILLWDTTAVQKVLDKPGPKRMPEDLWVDLASDAQTAYTAINQLAASPKSTISFLQKRLVPHKLNQHWLATRLADLDSNSFAKRDAASRDLAKNVNVLEVYLRRELERTDSNEVKNRLRQILKSVRFAVPSPKELRQLRAITVLERIGSEESIAMLRDLAKGTPSAPLTREAIAASNRLSQLLNVER